MKTQILLHQAIHGTEPEYIWQEVNKISDISSENTEETLTYNLPSMNENENYLVEGRKFNWSELYGNLDEGKYRFVLSDDNAQIIRVLFQIDENGEISYEETSIAW